MDSPDLPDSPASLIIGLAGGSGSGKTTVAKGIAEGMPAGSVRLIQYDSYYRDHPELDSEQRGSLNFDHPEALETALLVDHLIRLRAGEPVAVPVYDFSVHRRSSRTLPVRPAPIIVVEGILTFVDPALREQLDIKLYIDTDADLRVMRRIRRDLEQRGRDFESIRQQYYTTVRPMHERFVQPSKRFADLIIPEGGENAVALGVIIARLREVLG
jgi:uridine kinase